MAKPTRSLKSPPNSEPPTSNHDLPGVPAPTDGSAGVSRPRPWVARLVVAWVIAHFSLCAISYSSSIASSGLQGRVLAAFAPYLSVFHLDADGTPLHFSDASLSEKTHLISKSTVARPATDDDWKMIDPNESGSKLFGGMAGGDRQRRWQRLLSSMAELGENSQGNLVAWLIEPIVLPEPDAQQIRITRVPDLMTNVVEDAAPPPYTVSILRQEGQKPQLIQVSPSRLTAPAIKRSNEGVSP